MREQEDGEPSHHARRPMNAFLIFCKRHRSVVRDKYPNLENRSITKILGEWWANLDKDDKACYTVLAKQYKDAFFNANPDFKWYKLPAPPLRTARREPTDSHDAPDAVHLPDHEATNNNSTKLDYNKNLNADLCHADRPLSMFTPGKLADEAQMGGLSSLLAAKTDAKKLNSQLPSTFSFANTNSHLRLVKAIRSNDDNIRELQNALSETTRMFEDLDEENGVPHIAIPNDKITNQDVIDQIVDNRFTKEEDYAFQNQWLDDEKKSKRSCKGKKYQEFMAVGGFIVNKRQKRDFHERIADEEYNASCSWEGGAGAGCTPSERAHSPDKQGDRAMSDGDIKPDTDTVDTDNNINKSFKASDFDLDAKIRALPSLSLEKFQQRKRENKRKKKTFNLKPKCEEPRYTSFARDTAIGSQKRKPRKISITRLEINSLISAVEVSEGRRRGEPAAEGPAAACASADLLALATLAEVAANTSKIGGAAIL